MDAGDEIERAGQDGRSRWLRFIAAQPLRRPAVSIRAITASARRLRPDGVAGLRDRLGDRIVAYGSAHDQTARRKVDVDPVHAADG